MMHCNMHGVSGRSVEEILESVITWYNVYTYILMSHKLISKVQAEYWKSDYDVKEHFS